jgi:hypothetical protein
MGSKINGAGTAEVALTKGLELRDAAAIVARNVEQELETDGAGALARRSAVRLQAVADMYFQLIEGTQDAGRLDVLVKRWGWIQNSAMRAWQAVAAMEKKAGHGDADEILSVYRDDHANNS